MSDIRLLDARPSADEVDALDRVLGPAPGRDTRQVRTARGRRDLLLPALHALHERVGWISRGGLNEICRRLDVAPADAYGVATFYGMFSVEPRPRRLVHVCVDVACAARRAEPLHQVPGDHGDALVVESPCLGMCERAPVALVEQAGEPHVAVPLCDVSAGDITRAAGETPSTDAVAAWDVTPSVPQRGSEGLVLLRRVGVVDPASLDDYRAHDGYRALARALELGPAGVRAEITASGLTGRGGAAFPTGRKWDAVAAHADGPRYLVCNADESEPGTFKDRVLLEGDPFSVVEAITIAAFATGCERAFVYLRGEYPVARARLRRAIDAAYAAGLLGADVAGSGVRVDVEVRLGAGAYICGEETAIFNSIEGFRGEPRSKPPFPVDVGLFGRPTVVNNVETLANVLPIVERGGAAFSAIGGGSSTGTKLFCVSGNVARPGVYEVASGTTLRELLALAGDVPEGRSLRAVLLGGAAGGFVGPHELDVPLTIEGTRAIGASLGSGVVCVLDDTVDLAGVLARIAAFFRHESCGQCVPCRVGTVRQHEAVERLVAGRPLAADTAGDLALLRDLAQVMRDSSICGLGQTAPNAIASALERFEVFP